MRNCLSALIIDEDRILLGTEEGLFCTELDRFEIGRIGESKKIHQIWYIREEQLLIILCGKQRQIRLLPIRALEVSDVEWIKVGESKNCITACTGIIRHSPPQNIHCIVMAIALSNKQRQISTTQIVVYEIDRNKSRHHKLCEFNVPYQVQNLQVLLDGRIAVGHLSGFTAYYIQNDAQPMCKK